jgi:hypothetical protein
VHREVSDRDARRPQFLATLPLGPITSNVRLEAGTIQSLGYFCHLALGAAQIQLARHQQHRPRHQECRSGRIQSANTAGSWRKR